MKKSYIVSSVAVFAALNVVCDMIVVPQFSSGVWFGLVFLISPITGMLLGPYAGFLSTLIGVMVGHTIIPRGIEEFVFTLGAPIGAAISGLMYEGRWKIVLVYYSALLAGYFLTPIALQLPLWGMWNVHCAYLVLILSILLGSRLQSRSEGSKRRWMIPALSSFIGLEADILYRIFIFIPGQTYQVFYGLPLEVLQGIWVAGALVTPIKVAVSSFTAAIIVSKLRASKMDIFYRIRNSSAS